MLREGDVCEDLPKVGMAQNLLKYFNELSCDQKPEKPQTKISATIRKRMEHEFKPRMSYKLTGVGTKVNNLVGFWEKLNQTNDNQTQDKVCISKNLVETAETVTL